MQKHFVSAEEKEKRKTMLRYLQEAEWRESNDGSYCVLCFPDTDDTHRQSPPNRHRK